MGERRRRTGFESRPLSSGGMRGPPVSGLLEWPRVPRGLCCRVLRPWSEIFSRVSEGFESRPQRSTRCQKYNVWPGQGPDRVSDRSGTFVFAFKPLPMQAGMVDRSSDRRDRGSGLSKHGGADRQWCDRARPSGRARSADPRSLVISTATTTEPSTFGCAMSDGWSVSSGAIAGTETFAMAAWRPVIPLGVRGRGRRSGWV